MALKLDGEIGTSSAVRKMVLIVRQYPFGNNDGMIFSESVFTGVWFPPSINRTYNTYISCSIVTKSGCFDQDQVLQHALWPLCEMQLRALLSRDDASRTIEIARDLRSLDQIWSLRYVDGRQVVGGHSEHNKSSSIMVKGFMTVIHPTERDAIITSD